MKNINDTDSKSSTFQFPFQSAFYEFEAVSNWLKCECGNWYFNVNEHKLSQSISSLCSAFTFCFLFGCFCEKHVKKRIIFRMLKHSKVVCETKMAHERLFLKSARMQFESFFYDSNVVFEYIIRFIDKLTFFFFERMV